MKKNTKILASILIATLLLSGCSSNSSSNSSTAVTAETEAPKTGNVFLDTEVKTVSTKIGAGYGTRAYIIIDKETAKTASQEDFAEFLKQRVDGKDYNWFTIDFGDGTGITLTGCQWEIAFYGKLDDEGRISGERYGYIKTVGAEKYLVEYTEEYFNYNS